MNHATAAPAPSVHPIVAGSDELGFLIDHRYWSPHIAADMARASGLGPLNDAHWRIIHHLRSHYLRSGGMPTMRSVCKANRVSTADLHALFGSCLTLLRIAGIPDPGEEARAYVN